MAIDPNAIAGTGAGSVAATSGTGAAGNLAAGSGGAGAAGTMSAGLAGRAAAGAAGVSGVGGVAAPAAGSGGASGAAAGSGGSAGGAGGAGAGGAAAGSGESGVGGTGGAAAGSGGAGGAPAAAKPPCLENPSQVVVAGDSYLNWITHTFPEDLTREAGQMYRMVAVGGASMATGGISGFIPDQLTAALAQDDDVIAVIMSGGGNDILIPDVFMFPGGDQCKEVLESPTIKACQDIVGTAFMKAREVMNDVAAAGIEDIVYIFYPHIPGGGAGGANPNAILDYSLPMARDLCTSTEAMTDGKLRCHFLDLVPVFEGKPELFADDGIHENSMGSAAMAKEVVKILKDKCVAQPASSGCCEP